MLDNIKGEFDKWKWYTFGAIFIGLLILAGITWATHKMQPMWVGAACIIIPVAIVQIWHWRAESDDF